MKKIEASVGIGFVGAVHMRIFEFEDDVTAKEIEETVIEWSNNYIDIRWSEIYKLGGVVVGGLERSTSINKG